MQVENHRWRNARSMERALCRVFSVSPLTGDYGQDRRAVFLQPFGTHSRYLGQPGFGLGSVSGDPSQERVVGHNIGRHIGCLRRLQPPAAQPLKESLVHRASVFILARWLVGWVGGQWRLG